MWAEWPSSSFTVMRPGSRSACQTIGSPPLQNSEPAQSQEASGTATSRRPFPTKQGGACRLTEGSKTDDHWRMVCRALVGGTDACLLQTRCHARLRTRAYGSVNHTDMKRRTPAPEPELGGDTGWREPSRRLLAPRQTVSGADPGSRTAAARPCAGRSDRCPWTHRCNQASSNRPIRRAHGMTASSPGRCGCNPT